MAALPQNVLLALGGDVLQKYGTIVKRYAPPVRGGEIAYTFARTGTAWWLNSAGLLQAAAGGIARVEWALDPVTTVLQLYLLLEAAATNVVLQNRNLSIAPWNTANMTPVLNKTGIDGAVNTATTLTASAANGTCLQAITLASSARFQSAWVQRVTGSGEIDITTDGGATWTNIISQLVLSGWNRVTIPTQTLANPNVGFRIVANGDAIAVDGVQNETGTFRTSTILTTSAAVTRNADTLTVPWYVTPGALWFYVRFLERGSAASNSSAGPGIIGSSPPYIRYDSFLNPGYRFNHNNGSTAVVSSAAGVPTYGQVCELLGFLFADGSVQLRQSINGAADTVGSQSAANAFAAAWGALSIGVAPSGFAGAISRYLIGTGPSTLVPDIPTARAIPL